MTISASNKVPGSYLEIVFGVGPVSAGDAPRIVCLVGHMLSTGTATGDTPTLTTSEEDAKTYFGQGSELHLMVKAALSANPSCLLYCVGLTAPSGGTAATATITPTGTTSSADGTITVSVCGYSADVLIPSGSTPTAACTLLKAAINGQPDLPVVATGTTTCIITARHKGTRGNEIKVSSSGTTTGLTWTHVSGSLTTGAGSDTLTTAQANMAPSRFHLIAVAEADSTSITSWRTHVNTYAGPLVGIRQQVVAATMDTLANSETLAIAVNTPRVQIVWHYNGLDLSPWVAAAVAATRAYYESIDPAAPMSMQHGTQVVGIRPQVSLADGPDPLTELPAALNNGLTPLVSDQSGNVYICRSITSRSQDVNGNPNYAVLDTAKVTGVDYFADQLAVSWPGFVAANPKQAPDSATTETPQPGVATPRGVKSWIYEQQKALSPEVAGDKAVLVNVDENAPNIIVSIPTSPAGRFAAKIPCDIIEGNYQFDATLSQVG